MTASTHVSRLALLSLLAAALSPVPALGEGDRSPSCYEVRIDDEVNPTLSFSGCHCPQPGREAIVSSFSQRYVEGGDVRSSRLRPGFEHELIQEGHEVTVTPQDEDGATAHAIVWRMDTLVYAPSLSIADRDTREEFRRRPIQRRETFQHLIALPAGEGVSVRVPDPEHSAARQISVTRRDGAVLARGCEE